MISIEEDKRERGLRQEKGDKGEGRRGDKEAGKDGKSESKGEKLGREGRTKVGNEEKGRARRRKRTGRYWKWRMTRSGRERQRALLHK